MEQLLAHLFGDYFLQSHWMALNKSKRSWPCLIHVSLYSLPFLLLTRSWKALLFIAVTHFIIDRFGLVRYLMWLKNNLGPIIEWESNPREMDYGIWNWRRPFPRWRICSRTGYFDERSEDEFTIKFKANLTTPGTMIVPPDEFAEKQELMDAYAAGCKIAEPRPLFVTVWLTIIADNSLHLFCNYVALKWLQ